MSTSAKRATFESKYGSNTSAGLKIDIGINKHSLKKGADGSEIAIEVGGLGLSTHDDKGSIKHASVGRQRPDNLMIVG